MLNVLRKNSLKYGLVGAYTLILKSSLEKNYVTGHVTTSSKIYTRKVVIKIVLMFGSSFIILGHPSKSEYSGLSNAEKCKFYRSKGSEQKEKNDALRKKLYGTLN